MPVIALILFSALLLPAQRGTPAAPAKSEESGAVEGRVVNAATGEPLNKATVRLRRAGGPREAQGPRTYSASTDPSGNFTVTGVPPGMYHLSAVRNGFVDADYGSRDPQRAGTPISLSPGQRLAGIVLQMTPHGVIAGRVLDEDGEPVVGAQVQAMHYRYPQGRKQLVPYGDDGTNDLGEYRIFGLPPGRYYVSAAPRRVFQMRAGEEQAPEEYVPTWFPNTTDPAAAAAVDVTPGSQLRGMDLTLAKRRTFRVRGKVTDASGGGGGRMMVFLQSRALSSRFAHRPAAVDRNGNFEIAGVSPGSYTLVASLPARGRPLTGRLAVDVGDGNLDNLNLVIHPAMSIPGTLRVDGQTSEGLSGIQVALRPREGAIFGGAAPARMQPDGSFTLAGISPDEYDVHVTGLPEGFYVKSILANGQDVLLPGLDLTRGNSGPLQIVLSPKAGTATGVALNDRQEPSSGATVVLVPREKERRPLARFYHTATSDNSGRFTVKNLEPGQYLLFAWQEVESGRWFDPDFLQPLENSGQPVNIREGGQEDIKVAVLR